MRSSTRSSVMAAAAIAMLAASDAMPTPRKGSARAHKPTPPRMDTELAREIAEHNAKVDAKKAERSLRRLADKNAGY